MRKIVLATATLMTMSGIALANPDDKADSRQVTDLVGSTVALGAVMSDQEMQTVVGTDDGADPAAMEAYMLVMEHMHHNMADVKMTGNPDVDFALGMIPHHQGAIDMAQVVLKYGTDPQIRQLAESIIESQGAEILFLKNWLEFHSLAF